MASRAQATRRASLAAALAAGLLGGFAGPASATFHLERVNELMLASATGDPGVQFVELLDKGGSEEQFTPVFAPYKLVVYDAAGNKLGEHTLDPGGLRAGSAAGQAYLISTAAADGAFGLTGNERLDVALPSGAGQACFEANPSPSAFNCMTWGTITNAVATNSNGTGTSHGPAPPSGQSDQLQADGSVVVASPTPSAQNANGSSGGPPPGAAPSGPYGTPAPDSTGPQASVAIVRRSLESVLRRGLALAIGVDEAARIDVTLTLARGQARRYGVPRVIGHTIARLGGSGRRTLRIKPTRGTRARLRRAGRLSLRLALTATDAAGNRSRVVRRLTLRS